MLLCAFAENVISFRAKRSYAHTAIAIATTAAAIAVIIRILPAEKTIKLKFIYPRAA